METSIGPRVRICGHCRNSKLENNDNFRQRVYKNGTRYFQSICRDCERQKSNDYNSNHRQERKQYQASYLTTHPGYIKDWKIENREKLNEQERDRRLNDVNFRLKKNVSRAISHVINKENTSIIEYLPYTIDELRQNLETKFEYWMTWENYGNYRKNIWKDEDFTTWIWQVDHIIPHSTFKYATMDCQEFRDCWALSNLRPLSAKTNIMDGATRMRH